MNTATEFPGFDGTPTKQRFPIYGVWAEGKSFRLGVQVRTPSGAEGGSGAMKPLDTLLTSRKQVETVTGDLNAKVWQAIAA